jgi:hypothetical protein
MLPLPTKKIKQQWRQRKKAILLMTSPWEHSQQEG